MNHSVFAKLVAIMVMMAASLLLLVGGFFGFIVGPNLHTSVDVVLQEYTRGLAAGSLDLANAKDLSARLNLLVRYEGAATNWSTANDLPRIDDVQQGRVRKGTATLLRRNYYVVPAPDGGAYLFAWSLGPQMKEAHAALVVLLLLVMVAVVVITYIVLKRLLGPLRRLNDGVDRLSAGQLDVVLPNETHDEFGRLTDAFNHMVGRVRAMIGARDQLLLDVSHELRSPLTRMKVALELLPDGAQRNGMAADIAEMERMIAELLELERLRDGCRLRIVRHDLVPILREVAESFQDKPPGVRIVAPPGELLVDIDAQKIRTVVRNLLENAAKYSLPQSRPVEISAMQDDQTILIRVADDGPGIPEDEAERVFEPFYRLDRSRSKNTGGYGLGLSICKRVMEAHGGDITLERDRDKGASFTLTLPTPRESSIHPRAANSVSPTG
jgi:signal transduction histidine kinase